MSEYSTSLVNEAEISEEFSRLFNDYIKTEKREGQVVQGVIIGFERDSVVIDVGLKSEGRVALSEFIVDNQKPELNIGDKVEVYIEKLEGKGGRIVLSREKAIRDMAWAKFREICSQGVTVEGRIIGKVKGGFAVELEGIVAFLPGSQVDIRPIKDISILIGIEQPFKVLKVDEAQGNVVVSRRAILEESRREARQELLETIKEGAILEGTVKNITDYGAFVDLGFMDGLLHITDISWSKISHPSELLSLGQALKVVVIKYNPESQRVSLGLKQLEPNPWEKIVDKYTVGSKFKGIVSSIVDYGAFVTLEPKVEGLVYHTEISWNAKGIHPRKLLKVDDEVEVMVLDVDVTRHIMSLSIKQCKENPCAKFAAECPIGTKIIGIIKNVADFGMFITVGGEDNPDDAIDVLVPATEISWDKPPEAGLKDYSKGMQVDGIVIGIDLERERVTVSLKQVTKAEVDSAIERILEEKIIRCIVLEVKKDGIDVALPNDLGRTFIKKSELSKHKDGQRPERFSVGEAVNAKLLHFDKQSRQAHLSIKVLEIEEERKAIAEFGSKDTGASLGDILGAALREGHNQ